MRCSYCHTDQPDDAAFCTTCGKALTPSTRTNALTTQSQSVPQTTPMPQQMPQQQTFQQQAYQTQAYQQQPANKLNQKTIALIIAVVVAVIAIVIVVVALSANGSSNQQIPQNTAPTTTTPNNNDQDDSSISSSSSSSSTSTESSTNASSGATNTGDYTVATSGNDRIYTNNDHGYSIIVPSSYKVSTSDFGNAMFFTDTANDMTITLNCTNNTDHLNVQQCYDQLAAGHDVSYKFVGDKSCVASYISGSTEYYDKAVVGSGSILTISFQYPHANNATCDRLLEKIVDTIQPGNLSVSHAF